MRTRPGENGVREADGGEFQEGRQEQQGQMLLRGQGIWGLKP